MEWLTENWQTLFSILTSAVGIAAAVATLTPNESDNVIIQKILDVINTVGANFGRASNAPDA